MITVGSPVIINGVQYDVRSIVDRGGLSTIYLAVDTTTTHLVVIKEFIYSRFYDPVTRVNDCEEYWENEILNTQAQARSGMKCVHVLNYVKHPDLETPEYYIVLTYIEGQTFLKFYQEFVQTCRGLANLDLASIVRFIFLPLVHLLSYCHTKEFLIHRDISVKNILVQSNDQGEFWPVLIDWGLSKYIGPDWIFYTPKPYMTQNMPRDIPITQKGAPPEIRFGYMPTAASDIYYLAHLMYFVFTGGIMREDSELDTPDAFVLFPKSINMFVPDIFNDLVVHMTQYEPHDRPSSMAVIEHDLKDLITIKGVHFDFDFFAEHPDTDEITGKLL